MATQADVDAPERRVQAACKGSACGRRSRPERRERAAEERGESPRTAERMRGGVGSGHAGRWTDRLTDRQATEAHPAHGVAALRLAYERGRALPVTMDCLRHTPVTCLQACAKETVCDNQDSRWNKGVPRNGCRK